MNGPRLNVRFGKHDSDLLDLLRKAEALTGMDQSDLARMALRVVLPCILDGCDPKGGSCFDKDTSGDVCALRDAASAKRMELLKLLDELTDEVKRTPPGAIHGPVQFTPASDQAKTDRIRDRLQIAKDLLRQISEVV